MYQTEYQCQECGSFCAETYDHYWLVCPRCSRIITDFKPPDFHPAGNWDFHDVDGMEMKASHGSSSLTEHAFDH